MQNRLQSILNVAKASENEAARRFVQARTSWQSDETKLRELLTFRDDYQVTQTERQSAGHFQSMRIFLSQLSQAIDQQEVQVVTMLNVMKSEETSWLATRVKQKSIVRLFEKRAERTTKEENRQEQKELDEISRLTDFSSKLLISDYD